jgi:hypothetical protein
MTRKLIRVARTPDQEVFFHDIDFPRGTRAVGLNPQHVLNPHELFHMQGEFFEIEEAGVETLLKYLATLHPGREVQVFELVQVAQCPAADMVIKQVSKDGILPG